MYGLEDNAQFAARQPVYEVSVLGVDTVSSFELQESMFLPPYHLEQPMFALCGQTCARRHIAAVEDMRAYSRKLLDLLDKRPTRQRLHAAYAHRKQGY